MARYWIAKPKIKESPEQMYRAYIFNFQEDMWQFVYRKISKSTVAKREASLEVFEILRENRRRFFRHLDNPTSNIIMNQHVSFIHDALTNLLTMLENDKGTFYRGVLRVYNEFAMST